MAGGRFALAQRTPQASVTNRLEWVTVGGECTHVGATPAMPSRVDNQCVRDSLSARTRRLYEQFDRQGYRVVSSQCALRFDDLEMYCMINAVKS
jgi:hypothetical protein